MLTDQVNHISNSFKQQIKNFFGLPEDNRADEYAAALITKIEENSLALLVSRRGLDQRNKNFTIEGFNLKINLIRFLLSVVLIRIIIIFVYLDDDRVNFYLANPFRKLPFAFNFLLLLIIIFIVLFILREYSIYLETIGAIMPIQILKTIRESGFDSTILLLSPNQTRIFKRIFILTAANSTNFLNFTKISSPLCLIGFRLLDDEFLNNLTFFTYSTLWIILESLCARFCVTGLINTAMYVILIFPWYLGRLRTLVERLNSLLKLPIVEEAELTKFNLNMIDYLNEFETNTNKLKHMSFYLFTVIAFMSDCVLFIAISIPLPDQPIFRISLYFVGLTTPLLIVVFVYNASELADMFLLIHKLVVKVIPKCKGKLQTKLKTLEILERIDNPVIQIKIGDFFYVDRELCIYFILENASTVMLLLCNIRVQIK